MPFLAWLPNLLHPLSVIISWPLHRTQSRMLRPLRWWSHHVEGGWFPSHHMNKGRKCHQSHEEGPRSHWRQGLAGQRAGRRDITRPVYTAPRAAPASSTSLCWGSVVPLQEVQNCRNKLTESDHRRLRDMSGISWAGRRSVGDNKVVSGMGKVRLREACGSPNSELTGWQAPHTAESCCGALVI